MMRFLLGTIIACFISVGFALDPEQDKLIERIRPLGAVRVEGEQGQPLRTEKIVKPVALNGEEIYKRHCIACHSTGVAGAPKLHDAREWQPRRAKGMKILLENVTRGYNAMPPMGTCQECTSAELTQAIEYMLPKS